MSPYTLPDISVQTAVLAMDMIEKLERLKVIQLSTAPPRYPNEASDFERWEREAWEILGKVKSDWESKITGSLWLGAMTNLAATQAIYLERFEAALKLARNGL